MNTTTTQSQLLDIPLKDIIIISNYRHHKDTTDDAEFLDSIFKHGVLQAIMVRPKGKKYELVCGDRRVTAGRLVQKKYPERNTIPAMVRTLSDEEVFEIQIIENLQRKDVHPMDEAMAYKAMADKDWSIETIAAKIDKSTRYVANRLKLNDLIPELQEMFFANKLNLGHCLELCKVSEKNQQDFIESEVYEGEYNGSVAQIKDDLKHSYKNLADATFDINNKDLIFGIPPCTQCIKNTGCQRLLFPEEELRCTDTSCFKLKTEAAFNMQLSVAMQDVNTVFIGATNEKDGLGKDLMKKGHVVFNTNNVRIIDKPEMPERSNYEGNNDTPEEDEEEFNQDMVTFYEDVAAYEKQIETANKAFVVSGSRKGEEVYYSKIINTHSAPTAEDNDDTNTKKLIEELEAKLTKNKDADAKQVQLYIEKELYESNLKQPQNSNSTEWTLLRYLIYNKLHFIEQEKFFEIIEKDDDFDTDEALFMFLMGLSNTEWFVLLRLAFITNYAGAHPNGTDAYMMRKMADELGVDIHKLVMDQQVVADNRDAKLKKQIAELKKKLIAPDANTLAPNAKKSAKKAK